ncbi:flavin-containing monooxygenase [Alcanivorax sp. IL3]|uniref:flavin-containing monooxygenase n=1 Tax=Alcanivorax sp. IL3 TaxID=3396309 RepID=UPI0039C27D35
MTSKAKISAKTISVDVAIVGAGFGGLCMAIKLREAGNEDFVILEKAAEVGGAWYFNGYPGAACDVQSHLYSFSFAGKADWSKRYAPRDEIENYILDTVEQYQLRPFIQFNQEVNEAHFDETTGRWTVRTAAGMTIDCRHFVLASGPLHVPNVPSIKGLKRFKGKVMHSAEWDHSYDLVGKKVVSIGTGGSAIQYCPEIAPKVKKLSVFQRSAAWVIPGMSVAIGESSSACSNASRRYANCIGRGSTGVMNRGWRRPPARRRPNCWVPCASSSSACKSKTRRWRKS